jgi:glycyl-tRNA synthetase beta chain
VVIPRVRDKQSEQSIERRGPVVSAGLDANGNPTPALLGFAKSCGVAVEALQRTQDAKGEYFVFRTAKPGELLERHLAGIVQTALEKLPIPKLMRWGDNDARFVRPVHGLVMLHGERVVPGIVFGLHSAKSGRKTCGHRFMGKAEIVLKNADEYEARLHKSGMVIANFEMRKSEIETGLRAKAAKLGASLGSAEDAAFLLEEVTALVEHPSIYVGEFDPAFLVVPQECLTLTMRQNQKYFPLFAQDGKLLPKFLIVSNVAAPSPGEIVSGNERVLRARLSDAKFFYDQDRKTRLETRVPKLADVVYHGKLGSQLERAERIQLLAGTIAREIGTDPMLAERAAWLSKADLLTEMVGEFPKLQGIMGRYYALHDGEPPQVADAIEAHYRPRFAGDIVPQDKVGAAVALADKLDTLTGLFGIGQVPTGEKDPFGLRRAALGVIRILIERGLPIPIDKLIGSAIAGFRVRIGDARSELLLFIHDRLSGYLRDKGYSTLEVDSVVSKGPTRIDLTLGQLDAVRAFNKLPEAQSLAAANKRVANILKQAAAKGESFENLEPTMLKEPAELALFDALKTISQKATAHYDRGDFTGYLKAFAVLRSPVDAFFDSVMVMVEDPGMRQNRLALLADLRKQMNRVADISKLAA